MSVIRTYQKYEFSKELLISNYYSPSKCFDKSFFFGCYPQPADTGAQVTAKEFNYVIGQSVTGFVNRVDTDWVWLSISRDVRAQLYVLDSASEPSELEEFQKRFHVGQALTGYVLSSSKEKKMLRLVLQAFAIFPVRVNGDVSNSISKEITTVHLREGQAVGGRIFKILPGIGGLLVQIDPHLYGKVHYTELTDDWVPDPLSGYREGQFVTCKVLEVSRSVTGTTHIDLSLRLASAALLSRKPAEIGYTSYLVSCLLYCVFSHIVDHNLKRSCMFCLCLCFRSNFLKDIT